MLRNLPECSIGLVLSMVLKPNALFSLLYSLLRFIDFITDWFEIDLSINWLTPFKVTSHLQRPKTKSFFLLFDQTELKHFTCPRKKIPKSTRVI